MKLLFLTGSRGEWGYIRPILRLCQLQKIDYSICATNMHLLPSHGLAVNEILRDGFEVDDQLYMSLEGGNHITMTKSLGVLLSSLADVISRVKPDWIVLAGDRGEQLAGAIAGAYTYTPVAHIQAGERSGNIDGMARHAIGKLVHLHFAANEDAAERLRRLGEQDFRIHLVGAPQLDELVSAEFSTPEDLSNRLDVDLSKPFLLVAQHPVTEEYDKARDQISVTVEAVNSFDMPKVWILPNNDAGGAIIRDCILGSRAGRSYMFDNLPRRDYLGLLRSCQAIVGNSSSGLLEAPTFKIPAVNIGRRQNDRVQAANVLNCDFDVEAVRACVSQACSQEFRNSIQNISNPYGDGHSSERIVDILRKTQRDSVLLTKELTI